MRLRTGYVIDTCSNKEQRTVWVNDGSILNCYEVRSMFVYADWLA